MPLSKARMRARKKQDRAKSGFDKQLSPLTGANDVKPESVIECLREMPLVSRQDRADKPPGVDYIDGDGYPVYDEG